MIRNLVSIFVMLCMVIGLLCPVPDAGAETAPPTSQITTYHGIALVGDMLYIRGQDGIWQKNLREGTETLLMSYYDMASKLEVFPNGIFPYENTFGVVDEKRQTISVWREGGFQPLVTLENALNLADGWSASFARQGDTLWVNDGRQLQAVSLTTGAVKLIRIPGIRGIAAYPQGGIIAIQEVNGTAQVIHIPTTTDFPTTLMMLPGDGATGLACDESAGMVYVVMRGMLNRYENGEWLPRVPMTGDGAVGCAIWEGNYLYVSSQHLLMRSLDDSDLVTVVIQGGGSIDLPDVPFMLENPAIAIRRTGKPGCPEDVYMAVTTGDDSVDLYGMYVSTGFLRLLEKGFLQPIESDFLKEDVLAMHPVIQAAVMQDGQLYAYPIHMNWVESWRTHAEYTEMKMPATLEELLDFADSWRKEGNDLHAVSSYSVSNELTRWKYAVYALQQWILTHTDETLRFSEEPFVRLMERIMALPIEDEEYFSENELNGVFNWDLTVQILNFHVKEGTLTTCPAVMDPEEVVVPARMQVYVINPNSRHREQAIEFLKYQATHRIPSEQGKLYQFIENGINPVYYETLQMYQAELKAAQQALDQGKPEDRMELLAQLQLAKANLQQYEDEIEDYRLFDQEDLSLYQSYYVPRIKIVTTPLLDTGDSVSPGLWPHLKELLQQCLDGQLSAAMMLQRMDELWMQHRIEQK